MLKRKTGTKDCGVQERPPVVQTKEDCSHHIYSYATGVLNETAESLVTGLRGPKFAGSRFISGNPAKVPSGDPRAQVRVEIEWFMQIPIKGLNAISLHS